ncbi:hypothetical protein [Fibrella arboris]|uniref:hypothetical protein n=1 Tax=Fibrella arboris TaxID=3242486 RepID=UPI0035216DE0
MKRTWASFAFLIGPTAFLLGCQQQKQEGQEKKVAEAAAGKTCYAYVSQTDTIRLTLRSSGAVVTGNLQYQLAEKDRNTGTISGQMRGDTLLADYRFQSEGVESVREVAFLLNGDTMIEGFGPVADKAGKVVFSPRSRITFSEQFPLTKTTCE